ncbi:MAG: hypothetical protein JXR46_15620 [Calditrichaceae bacterium]|nr:hypothetical protein [Calditrichaceae bacterium]MBN2710473.1 hypothetical protein [Calditrichaceae bacterium]RQV93593.1 MAG: hypothetical protein EH224_12015 [Calditrichota bacterium]
MNIKIPLFLMLAFYSFLFGQNDSNTVDYKKNSIQFFLLNDISAAYKRHISTKTALRIQIDFNSSYSDARIRYDNNSDPNDKNEYLEKNGNHNIYLFIDYLLHKNLSEKIKFIYGIGPLFEYSFGYLENTDHNEPRYDDLTYTSKVSAGLNLITGIELKLNSMISLNAEYRVHGLRSWEKNDIKYNRLSEGRWESYHQYKTDTWKYNVNYVRIGVSVYF